MMLPMTPYWRGASPRTKKIIKCLSLAGCISLTSGCSALGKPDSFTFVPDFPPNFIYELVATYVPAKGETCTVPKRNTKVGFNHHTDEYQDTSEVLLYRTVNGCPLALNSVGIMVTGIFGPGLGNRSSSYAAILVRGELPDHEKGTFNASDEGEFGAQCQWSFRTVGRHRYVIKLLSCINMDAAGNVQLQPAYTTYLRDQLPGKTVRFKVRLDDEERPGWGDTWVKVPGGWKRCMGEGFEDQLALCNGNYKDFSTFKLVDGRTCTIYPGCTENKEETREN